MQSTQSRRHRTSWVRTGALTSLALAAAVLTPSVEQEPGDPRSVEPVLAVRETTPTAQLQLQPQSTVVPGAPTGPTEAMTVSRSVPSAVWSAAADVAPGRTVRVRAVNGAPEPVNSLQDFVDVSGLASGPGSTVVLTPGLDASPTSPGRAQVTFDARAGGVITSEIVLGAGDTVFLRAIGDGSRIDIRGSGPGSTAPVAEEWYVSALAGGTVVIIASTFPFDLPSLGCRGGITRAVTPYGSCSSIGRLTVVQMPGEDRQYFLDYEFPPFSGPVPAANDAVENRRTTTPSATPTTEVETTEVETADRGVANPEPRVRTSSAPATTSTTTAPTATVPTTTAPVRRVTETVETGAETASSAPPTTATQPSPEPNP